MLKSLLGAALLGATACAQPAVCGPKECEAHCSAKAAPAAAAPAAPAGAMTAFESSLVGPLLEEVRKGIEPWSDKAIGICKGSGRDCDEFIGASTPDLPPGEYMLRAELKVPRAGPAGTWKVRLETECTTTKTLKTGETKNTNSSSKDYDVQFVGDEHGARLSPLVKIKSPNASGAQACTYKLSTLHADKPITWTGSWSVPVELE